MGDFAEPSAASRLPSHEAEKQEHQLESGVPDDRHAWPVLSISSTPREISKCPQQETLSSEAAIAFPEALLSLGSQVMDGVDTGIGMQAGDDDNGAARQTTSNGWAGADDIYAASTSGTRAATDGRPNRFPSASNLATKCRTISTEDDVDVIAKGRGKGREQRAAEARLSSAPSSSSLASSSPSTSAHPSPAPISLAFLDKVDAPFAPRSQTISPYGSAHPLYLAAKKYRLKVDQAGSPSTTAAASPEVTLASTSKSFCSPTPPSTSLSSGSRAAVLPELPKKQGKAVEPEQAEQKTHNNEVETFQQPVQVSASPSENPPDMGSTRAASTRIHRRPSPLDVPAPAAKRRRSNGGAFRVVKVEETDSDTTFLISSNEPIPVSASSSSRAESSLSGATSLHFPGAARSDQPHTAADSKTTATRAASPATSVDLRSNIADEDCECFIEELRTPNLRVPRQLPRPAIVQEMDYTDLQLDSSLENVPMPYILDNITLKGSALLSTVVESSIALPSTCTPGSSRPVIPRSVAMRTPTRLLNEATLPEFVLAVTSDETDKVMFLPVHGLVLAASSKSFSGLARPPIVAIQTSEEGEDTIRIVPVVHIHLPSSIAFSRLVPFFYTQESGSLLASLLPVQHLPSVSFAAAQSSPSLLASHLAKLDQQILAQYVHLNHSLWRTSVALGAARDELWKVLQASWAALVTALSIQHSQSLSKMEDLSKSSSSPQ